VYRLCPHTRSHICSCNTVKLQHDLILNLILGFGMYMCESNTDKPLLFTRLANACLEVTNKSNASVAWQGRIFLETLESVGGNMAIKQANCNASASRAAFLCLSSGCRRTNVIHFMCGVQQLRGPTCYPARAALVGGRDYFPLCKLTADRHPTIITDTIGFLGGL
jgi:hypothetical protein